MALWRDRLAGQQLLLVLDDAASSEQVRPLLPGAGGSLVLVTSRRHLTALEDATAISLDTLPPGEAAALLVRLAGRPGLSPADPAVAEITRLCGYLPLAIGMVARQLHHHPAWSAAGRAAELAAAVDRLELMATENLSVAAAFDLSYEDLTGGSAAAVPAARAAPGRRHRRLRRRRPGRHRPGGRPPRPGGPVRPVPAHRAGPGPVPAARPDPRARPRPGRPRGPGPVTGTRPPPGCWITTSTPPPAPTPSSPARPAPAPAAADGAIPAAVPALADREQALAWARAERASLLACLDHATGTGQHARVIALTAGLAGLLAARRPLGRGHHPPHSRDPGRTASR